jgi:hypothetical protein
MTTGNPNSLMPQTSHCGLTVTVERFLQFVKQDGSIILTDGGMQIDFNDEQE